MYEGRGFGLPELDTCHSSILACHIYFMDKTAGHHPYLTVYERSVAISASIKELDGPMGFVNGT